MSWNEIGKIVLELIAGIGGVGVIFIAVIKFSLNIIAERLASKYELKLNKEMEQYKADLDSGKHISRALFDKEFEIYQSFANIFGKLYNELQYYHDAKKPSDDMAFNKDISELMEDYGEIGGNNIIMEELENYISNDIMQFREQLAKTGAFVPHDNWILYMDLCNICHKYMKTNAEDDFKNITLLMGKMQIKLREYLTELIIIE